MRRSALLAAALLAPLAACVTTPLTREGAQVRVVERVGPECRSIGQVREVVWTNTMDLDVIDDALRAVRNRAAKQGADTLVLSAPQVSYCDGNTTAVYVGIGYRCPPETNRSP